MFDRAIIDTDKFMDLPVSAKALYFLLGMEADDEGFVSYKKVLRIHGGTNDDIKVLMAKNFIIGFPSGVVVITDWNTNNYLDSRRTKETEYQIEKSQLLLTKNNKYQLTTSAKQSLSNGSASIEESSIEENSIEESMADDFSSPSSVSKDFFNNINSDYRAKALHYLVERGLNEETVKEEMLKFISYWTELNKSGKKQRWETEKTFEVNRRLATWFSNIKNFNKQGITKKAVMPEITW